VVELVREVFAGGVIAAAPRLDSDMDERLRADPGVAGAALPWTYGVHPLDFRVRP
jgi:hypothetical protein